jgi:hypothetical protein
MLENNHNFRIRSLNQISIFGPGLLWLLLALAVYRAIARYERPERARIYRSTQLDPNSDQIMPYLNGPSKRPR